MSEDRACCWCSRRSGMISVVVVYVTLMIDNMLLTSVVPILPEFFMQHQEAEIISLDTANTITTPDRPQNATTWKKLTVYSNDSEILVTVETSLEGFSNNTTVNETANACEGKHNKEELAAKNIFLAFLLASKPLVQMISNVFVGPLCDKVGFDIPMFIGYIVIIASSILFAFGESYAVLFAARALQGIGSACAATAGMAMLASQYQDDDERGRMLGVALGGLATGVLVGPSFASATYQLTGGKKVPFIILACFAFLVALLQMISRLFRPVDKFEAKAAPSILKLLKDPYILIAAAALMLGNMSIGVLEASLPTWLITTLCAAEWMLGVAMLPLAISYLIAVTIFSRVTTSRYRWLVCFLSFFVTALGSILLSLCRTFLQIIGPGTMIGTATGMVDSTIFPILGSLADSRHSAVYGGIYAIGDAAFCAAFIFGPLLAGTIVHEIGFKWVMIAVAILNLLFAPLVLFLKNPRTLEEEKQGILHNSNSENAGQDLTPESLSLGRIVERQNAYEKLE